MLSSPSVGNFIVRHVSAAEILDSRGTPTVEVTITLSSGHGSASVPSGKSTGRNEALELRDDDHTRYRGMGVQKAILGIERDIAPVLGLELFHSLNDKASLLPVPCFNVINGGAHADNALEFQEFMIVPLGAATFADALRAGIESVLGKEGRYAGAAAFARNRQ